MKIGKQQLTRAQHFALFRLRRAFARVLGGHCHLRAAMADPDGSHGKLARFYITRLLPEHVGLLAHVRAADGDLMAISPDDLAA